MAYASAIDGFAGAPGEPDLAAIIEKFIADARRLIALGVGDRDIRDVDRAFLFDDAAGLAGGLLGMALHHVHALHHDAVLVAQHAQHLTRPALVAASDDDDAVALLDLEFSRHGLQHLGRQRDDFHELPGAQFARHRPENARADRLVLRRDQHRGIAVEANGAAIGAPNFLRGTHDDGAMDVALLDAAARNRLLHRHHDDVADHRIFPLGAAQYLDALDPTSAGIVGDIEIGLHLDHDAALASSTTVQRLRLEMGRLSSMRTTSPTLCALASSCAAYFFERVMNFLYIGCMTRRSTLTMIVLSDLSLTTTPWRIRFGMSLSPRPARARPEWSGCARRRGALRVCGRYFPTGRWRVENAN